ncbi:MAG TPA: phytanoyl-CoA dioxygenase family protein [Thermohalobaculum sp.]|nr:phytanoyl-CoA dioxygenase family protein [Thermohalobaculum sp.]
MLATTLRQHLFELDLHGFTVIPDVLQTNQLDAINSANTRLLETHGEDLVFHGRAGHLANCVALDPVYFPCIDHEKVLPVIEGILGTEIILGSLNSRVVRPGEGDQAFHADIPNQLRKSGAPVMVNTVWALVDFTAQNGATRIVPGSHRHPDTVPPTDLTMTFIHRAEMSAGSVLVFNGQCWHAGSANHGKAPRPALFGHYRVSSWMRFQCDPHRGFQPEWFDQLNDRQKRLLRMQKGPGHPTSSDYDEG